ncbi:MAG: caspase family protein [Bryobacteraceae bacterium]
MRIVRSTGRRRGAWLSCSLLFVAAAAPALQAQESGKRVALVIGNDAYSMSPLKNAVNDAHAMDMALKTAGFQTVTLENAKKADMDRAIGEFLDKLGPDDTALFFFAGHGVQIENENFLVPVDFPQVATISAAKFACMSVARIFDELKRKRAKRNIVILDACRSNPLAAKYSLEAGLANPQDAPKETFIAFSTGPDQTATDNPDGRDSWFTEALADYISQSGLTVEISEIFTRVKKRVSDATGGRQTPWTTSNLTSRFYFHRPPNAGSEIDASLIEKWMEDAQARERREEWAGAIDLVNQVLEKKPGGALETLAQKKLPYLEARKRAQARFDAGDYAAAAGLYEQALKLDPFAIDAALQGVNSYLLEDHLPEAVALLQTMRLRGTSAAVQTADQMLAQLAAVSPEAAKEAQSSVPQPPPIEEVFSDTHFGVPDWDAGKRHLEATAIDLTRWTNDLKMEVPMPALIVSTVTATPAPADAAAAAQTPAGATPPDQATAEQAAAVNNAIFHVEVVPTGDTRNLRLRSDAPEDFGYVQFDGPAGETPVLFEGTRVVLPTKLKLPTGKYEVRTVDAGKVVNRQDLEVTPLSTQTFKVKRP